MATLEGVQKAHAHIKTVLAPTPILTSSTIDGMVGCKVLFKSEHLQKTGSFKARGAVHNMRIVTERGTKGVITHSSGNHGQAVAWAARAAGVGCTVVVPDGAPEAKLAAIEGYGARIVRCENTPAARNSTCESLSKSEGLDSIHPCYTIDTIEGQGSLAMELMEQLPSVPPLFIAVGGGGLASGIALVLPDTPLYLVEPEGKNLRQQLDASEAIEQCSLPTIADGIRTRLIGEENLKVLRTHKHIHVVTVTETEIRSAMVLLWKRLKQHIEPTAAVPLAGLIKMSAQSPLPFNQAVVILCGGNVDASFTP
ncbi:hypothetical protein PRIPAC_73094 [Pristionchus pacificus]|uniref:Serine racemase n=1 Tax=Pristionchus pacificus TaxID=54126 RepID=A0A454XPE1_PRIPA|nr:hypothetical protein PRIPAC_73094 [Pristionchus pacificus]|eukprot:PDM80717.1 hypothetical protein PRIPAC_35720 [Pristionchus pacificus]